MHSYLRPLPPLLQPAANADKAADMARYMRHQFPFLGVPATPRRTLFRQFLAEQGLPPLDQLAAIIYDLWDLPEREYQYVGVDLLVRFRRRLPPPFVAELESLIVTKSWWDTVDLLAGQVVGAHFARHGRVRDKAIARWRQADNIWLRRTTLLFQLKYKAQTDTDLLLALIQENLASQEFFIQKAIGWALREYSKTDGAAVEAFVARTPLAPLSRREALKWLAARGRPAG